MGLVSVLLCLREQGGLRREGEMGEQAVGGAVRTHMTPGKFVVLYRYNQGAPNRYSSNIKDHWSQITITNVVGMRKCGIVQELPKCDTGT